MARPKKIPKTPREPAPGIPWVVWPADAGDDLVAAAELAIKLGAAPACGGCGEVHEHGHFCPVTGKRFLMAGLGASDPPGKVERAIQKGEWREEWWSPTKAEVSMLLDQSYLTRADCRPHHLARVLDERNSPWLRLAVARIRGFGPETIALDEAVDTDWGALATELATAGERPAVNPSEIHDVLAAVLPPAEWKRYLDGLAMATGYARDSVYWLSREAAKAADVKKSIEDRVEGMRSGRLDLSDLASFGSGITGHVGEVARLAAGSACRPGAMLGVLKKSGLWGDEEAMDVLENVDLDTIDVLHLQVLLRARASGLRWENSCEPASRKIDLRDLFGNRAGSWGVDAFGAANVGRAGLAMADDESVREFLKRLRRVGDQESLDRLINQCDPMDLAAECHARGGALLQEFVMSTRGAWPREREWAARRWEPIPSDNVLAAFVACPNDVRKRLEGKAKKAFEDWIYVGGNSCYSQEAPPGRRGLEEIDTYGRLARAAFGAEYVLPQQ